ncbi:MAG: type II toxin-antitoxin system HicB family antitoxin [Acetobacteraceae bacterium]|nr:type II toxin-antitoxin system HicB family antitoxin [Acetobacteraceae bacterium]
MLRPLLVMAFGDDLADWLTARWRHLQRHWAWPTTAWHGRTLLLDAGERPTCGTSASLTFTVLLTAQDEGGYAASVPALPEVVTEGDTPHETLAMAEEAIRALLAYRSDMGIPVPQDPPPLVCRITVEV